MTTHDLKTHPEHFAAVWSGAKRAELRKDDRGFAAGDTLRLREWDHKKAEAALKARMPLLKAEWERAVAEEAEAAYTGREIVAVVTHILGGGPWLAEGYVMLSLDVIERRAA